jgi:hypothetical protein
MRDEVNRLETEKNANIIGYYRRTEKEGCGLGIEGYIIDYIIDCEYEQMGYDMPFNSDDYNDVLENLEPQATSIVEEFNRKTGQ